VDEDECVPILLCMIVFKKKKNVLFYLVDGQPIKKKKKTS